MQYKLRIAIAVACVVAILVSVSGCKSFDDAIKPVISGDNGNDSSQVLITGTRPFTEADLGDLRMDVWRTNTEPYPDSVQLYVRVLDSRGTFISNLAPPYYRGTMDYKEVWNNISEQIGDGGPTSQITDFDVREFSDQDSIPYEIALVLDHSGSMGSNITVLEDAALEFIGMKRAQDKISVVKFDNNPKLIVASTGSESELVSKFDKSGLQGFGGYTALYAAAKLGGDQIVHAPSDRPRALIVFTDGEDNASTITSSDLFKFCKNNNIPVFTIAFGAVNVEILSELSAYTGGRFYQTNTPDELRAAFRDLYLGLRNFYLIRYRPVRIDGKHIVSVGLNPPGGEATITGTTTYNTLMRSGVTFAYDPSRTNSDWKTTNWKDRDPNGNANQTNTNQNNPDPNNTNTGDVNNTNNNGVTTNIDENVLETDTIYFEYNKAVLEQRSMQTIKAVAELMKERKTMKIQVEGHTDAIGTEEYNQRLSNDRANVVRKALIDLGIPQNRVTAQGFGMSMPVAANTDEQGRQLNRRTVFRVIRW